jgi:hypothetical protein
MSTSESLHFGETQLDSGVSVDLGARAVALIAIMDFYAQNNRANGMNKLRNNRRSSLWKQYGSRTNEVTNQAHAKRNKMRDEYHASMQVLFPKDEMVAAGLMTEDEAELKYTSFKNLMNKIYMDPGLESRKWRHEVKDQVRHSADVIGIELAEPEARKMNNPDA